VPPDDAAALADRLAQLIRNPQAQHDLAVEARDLLARHASWADMRDGTTNAYRLATEVAATRSVQ
jgi:glycosyltransferase involved in cell wall biosynthesis